MEEKTRQRQPDYQVSVTQAEYMVLRALRGMSAEALGRLIDALESLVERGVSTEPREQLGMLMGALQSLPQRE